jgi:hypothetical protein
MVVLQIDSDGNGKRDAAVEPDQPVDPQKDKRIPGGFYAIMPSPVDGSVWGTVGVFAAKGAVVRPDHGLNPPADIDSQGCGVSVARQRSSRQLRPSAGSASRRRLRHGRLGWVGGDRCRQPVWGTSGLVGGTRRRRLSRPAPRERLATLELTKGKRIQVVSARRWARSRTHRGGRPF